MRAAIYLRISSDRTGEELGVTRQREDCEQLAGQRGWDVVQVYVENDTSASGKAKRPKFEAMLAGIKSGAFDVVVAWNLDRLTRNRQDTVRLIEMGQDAGLTIALARGSDLDMSHPMGRMMADQLAGWARYEIEQKGERQKRANSQRAMSGLPHAGRRAFGYNAGGLTINEDEALILKEVAHRFLNGWTYSEIAYYLNRQGYKTTTGRPFVGIAIRQMLQRKRYAGLREYEGVTYEGVWPPIFDADTWARIQYTIKERSSLAEGRPRSRRYLLTGLLTCGECGHQMNGGRQKAYNSDIVREAYRCKRQGSYEKHAGCGRVSRGSVPLEHFIKELIVFRLDSEALRTALSKDADPRSSGLLERLEANKTRLNQLVDDYADGTLTRAEFKRAKARAEAALSDVRDRLDAVHSSEAINGLLSAGESVRERWERETIGWRRQLIDMLIEKIVVNAGKKKPRYVVDGKTYYFAPEYIDIIWKA